MHVQTLLQQGAENDNGSKDDVVVLDGGPSQSLLAAPLTGGEQLQEPDQGKGQQGFGLAVFNLMNAVMGSGILGLSYAVRESGLAVFIGLILLMVMTAMFTVHLLLKSCKRANVTSYEELGQAAFGQTGFIAASSAIVLQNLGGMTSFLVIAGDLLPEVMTSIFASASPSPAVRLLTNRVFLMSVVMACIVLPLGLMKKIGLLGYVSGVSVAFSMLFVVMVMIKTPTTQCVPNALLLETCAFHWVHVTGHTFFVLPIIAFSFQCHTTLLPVYHELHNPTKTRMQAVGNVAILSAGVLYFLASFFGYLSFRGTVKPDLLYMYSTDPHDTLVIIVRSAIAGAVIFSLPLLNFPTRKALSFLIFGANDFRMWRHVVLTVSLNGVILGMAIGLPDVKVVFGFTGATATTTLIFVLPSIFYLKLIPGPWTGDPAKVFASIVVLFGVVLGITCVTGIIVDLIK